MTDESRKKLIAKAATKIMAMVQLSPVDKAELFATADTICMLAISDDQFLEVNRTRILQDCATSSGLPRR